MKFADKLAELTKHGNKQKLAEAAGLPPTAFSDYISKGTLPRADKAVAIARALGVPAEWLYDDSEGLPAPKTRAGAFLTDEQFMLEYARRYRDRATTLAAALKRVEALNLPSLARTVLGTPLTTALPDQVESDLRAVDRVAHAYFAFMELQPYVVFDRHRDFIIDGIENPSDLEGITGRVTAMRDENFYFAALEDMAGYRQRAARSGGSSATLEADRRMYLEGLERIERGEDSPTGPPQTEVVRKLSRRPSATGAGIGKAKT